MCLHCHGIRQRIYYKFATITCKILALSPQLYTSMISSIHSPSTAYATRTSDKPIGPFLALNFGPSLLCNWCSEALEWHSQFTLVSLHLFPHSVPPSKLCSLHKFLPHSLLCLVSCWLVVCTSVSAPDQRLNWGRKSVGAWTQILIRQRFGALPACWTN